MLGHVKLKLLHDKHHTNGIENLVAYYVHEYNMNPTSFVIELLHYYHYVSWDINIRSVLKLNTRPTHGGNKAFIVQLIWTKPTRLVGGSGTMQISPTL